MKKQIRVYGAFWDRKRGWVEVLDTREATKSLSVVETGITYRTTRAMEDATLTKNRAIVQEMIAQPDIEVIGPDGTSTPSAENNVLANGGVVSGKCGHGKGNGMYCSRSTGHAGRHMHSI